ncbi:efflux RND transporter periplasmic adaptor subunit [Burkholderiaceae bacterium DAT-1]|nr:efflux RND transporter periplasmic adaptor subunit [Burkholderiaceae bacterium DAT-1]
MDIQRAPVKRPLWRHRSFQIGIAATALAGVVIAGLNAKPAGMSVEKASVSLSTVERGQMVVNVQGNGLLRALDVRMLAAQSEARVERVLVQPGTRVEAGQLLVQLTNPALSQLTEENRWALEQAEAELRATRTQLEMEQLNQQSMIKTAEFTEETARQKLAVQAELIRHGMVSKLDYQATELNFKQQHENLALARERLNRGAANLKAQIEAREANVARLKKSLQRAQDLRDALSVKAPADGIVQELNLQPGQAVLAGMALTKLVRPGQLYAELQIQEAQVRDIAVGQTGQIDTRAGLIAAEVMRIAPSVANGTVKVDMRLTGALPRSARPDLSVEGSIDITRINDTIQVGRPVFAQADTQMNIYRVDASGMAERVRVSFGTAGINRIAIKQGLQPGDRIVVSDTTAWRDFDRVKLR